MLEFVVMENGEEYGVFNIKTKDKICGFSKGFFGLKAQGLAEDMRLSLEEQSKFEFDKKYKKKNAPKGDGRIEISFKRTDIREIRTVGGQTKEIIL